MKNPFLRAAIFVSIKSAAYNLILLIVGWFVGAKMSVTAYAIVFASLYAVMTFLFGEMMFLGNRIKWLPLIGVIAMSYLIDTLITIGFFSWYYDRNLFLEQTGLTHLLYGSIFIVSAGSAYVLKKRMAAMRGGVEGLA